VALASHPTFDAGLRTGACRLRPGRGAGENEVVYEQRPSRLPGAVRWSSSGGGPSRVLPDGCLDLLWYGGALVVAGPDTTAFMADETPGGVTGLRFAPGVGPGVFGVPAHELRDRRVRLDELWPSAQVRRLHERIAAAPDRGRFLEGVAGRRLSVSPPDPLIRGIAGLLAAGTSVARAASIVSLSERQLHRRSLDAFGYGPKTLARILRLGRALDLARTGVDATDCALRTGFTDQAHLARDVRALTGTTLGTLLS